MGGDVKILGLRGGILAFAHQNFQGGRKILKEIKCQKPEILKKSPAAGNVFVFLVKITNIS